MGSGRNVFFNPGAGPDPTYLTLDNIEMTHLEITSSTSGQAINWVGETSHDILFSHIYIHAWDASADNCTLILGPYGVYSQYNVYYEYNVIDGSDQTGGSSTTGSCYVFYTGYAGTHVLNNVIRYVVNPFVVTSGTGSQSMEIGGNLIEYGLTSIGGSHCNYIETGGGQFYIHDNVMRNPLCGADEMMWVGNAANELDYVWNNVMYNLDSSAGTATTPQAGENYSGIQVYFWNNTIVTGASQTNPCLAVASGRTPSGMTLYAQNIHCVTEGSNAIDPSFANYTTTFANNYNLVMPHLAATSDGYTASQTFAYSPTSPTSPTAGQGTNLISSWPSGFSTNDTGFGCTEGTINGVVQAVCPARTPSARPASGNWDVGAYQAPPGPAGNLKAKGY
jgi:hypothetical protein